MTTWQQALEIVSDVLDSAIIYDTLAVPSSCWFASVIGADLRGPEIVSDMTFFVAIYDTLQCPPAVGFDTYIGVSECAGH